MLRVVYGKLWVKGHGEYNQLLQQLMLSKNRNNKSVWRRKKSQYSSNIPLPEDPSFQQLKTVSKRLAIISRLEKKEVRASQNRTVNKTFSKLDLDYSTNLNRDASTQKNPRRPATSNETNNLRNMRNIKHAKQAMKEQKRINEYLMSEKGQSAAKKTYANTTTSVKQGLLGQYDRYNEMSKHELIEKLISLEYLANNIFRKNKALQDKIKSLDPNYNYN